MTKINKIRILFLIFYLLLINTTKADEFDDEEALFLLQQQEQKQTKNDRDPFEYFNRKIFDFNMILYDNIFIPYEKFYTKYIPLEIRWTLKNFIQNYTDTPQDMVLSVLDGDIEAIIVSCWRFILNTTFGLFGLFDFAYDTGLSKYNKKFEQILHFYHIPSGPYLVLPIIGSNTIRGTIGMAIEFIFTSPLFLHYMFGIIALSPFTFQYLANPFLLIDYQAKNLKWFSTAWRISNYYHIFIANIGMANILSETSIDRYISFRENYLSSLEDNMKQYENKRWNGVTNRDNICDYEGMVELPKECEEDPKIYNLGGDYLINN